MLALHYLAQQGERAVPVKEIASAYGLSTEFLAKTLRLLAHHDILESHQGINGGYRLHQDLGSISIATLLRITEGEMGLVRCEYEDCTIASVCTIRDPLHRLHRKIDDILQRTTIKDMFNEEQLTPQ